MCSWVVFCSDVLVVTRKNASWNSGWDVNAKDEELRIGLLKLGILLFTTGCFFKKLPNNLMISWVPPGKNGILVIKIPSWDCEVTIFVGKIMSKSMIRRILMEKNQVPFTKSTDGVAAQPWSSNMAMLWTLFNGSYRIPWKYLTNGGLHYDYIFLLKEFMGIQRKTTLVPPATFVGL